MNPLLRNLLILMIVIAVFGAVYLFIRQDSVNKAQDSYNLQLTIAVETAIADALFDATRTAEAPLAQYRLIILGETETLAEVAARYNTTVEVLRMANNLALDVQSGPGQEIIVPEGVQAFDPARRLDKYEAIDGDTLRGLSQRFQVPLDILETDNPVLAQRPLIPGDIVFIPVLL